jgi:two-component system alkaline phosphatase synthesis response regulator PhoP
MDKKFILLVDDEKEILDLYSAELKRSGFDVVTAGNGLDAIAEAKKRRPDLIIMDMKMPVMDGVEALDKIKHDPDLKDVRVVFLTAFSDPEFASIDDKFAKEAGATSFLKKGTTLNEFVIEVKRHLA